MADYDLYHAAGHQTPNNDPQQYQSQIQPPAQQFRPPVAPRPGGYPQGGSSYSQGAPSFQQNHLGTPESGYQPQGQQWQGQGQVQGYFPPQEPHSMNDTGAMGGLASQMGQMGLASDSGALTRPNKKKHRHAHHDIQQPAASSQAYNGIPQGSINPTQYLNSDAPQQMSPGHPYAGQQITPAMSQFPAQPTTPFSPGMQSSPNFGISNPQVPVPSGPPVSAQGRVDPEQIPSIPRSRDAAAQSYLDHIYPTMEQHLPPPGAVPFVAHDQGNSSPKFARLTLNNIPSSSEALSATALPLGLVLQPLAPLQAGEQAIPVLDFGEAGPPRCRRCRAYINPFMTFRSGGNKLVCNMCTFPNDVAPEYFAPTDPSGVRVDRAQRPELMTGTVEYMVPKEYWAKEPVGLCWLFLIDVSHDAITQGFLQAFCEGIMSALFGDDLKNATEETNGDNPDAGRKIPLGSKVGFVTFDKAMHFYNCNVSIKIHFLLPILKSSSQLWSKRKCL